MSASMSSTNNRPSFRSYAEDLVRKIGIRNAYSSDDALIRILLIFTVLTIVVISIIDINRKRSHVITLKELEKTIKPGTIMYKSIEEMPEPAKSAYIRTLVNSMNYHQASATSKYINSLRMVLMAGLVSEYITSGNLNKPMGIIAKTTFYSIIYTMLNL